jgi:hypothetical protein
VRDFSTIVTPLNDLTKKGIPFYWGAAQEHSFNTLIDKLTRAPLLHLPDSGKTFELERDASGAGIGGVLLQEGKHIAYFSEKLSRHSLNYSTYDKKLYALVHVLDTWQHYLWPKEFVITDALSRRYTMLSQFDHKFFGLESIKEVYATHVDFKAAYENCREGRMWNKYMLHDGLLYHANKLCVPASSVHLLFLQEVHGGGLMGHFRVKKIEDVLATHFFWPKMRRDVERYVSRCTTCNKAKS